ncbi:cytoskeleton-associated protein 2-like [Zootoca vivipara]|uniref:cytoskeleton-associated protein 2-like n=1 Tax=Zootoca vivipara TaxID=8524 RepID=UPI00293C0163|nr:cytoskeleton-associated protein 2-like [Zootoca vivipara]
MEAPRSAGGPGLRRGGGGREEIAAAAVEKRRQRLQEYLAAKGRLRPASTKPYLKDNSRQKTQAPSKGQPTVRSWKNVAPSTARSALTREAKGSGLASKVLPDKPSRALVHREPNNAPTQIPRKGGPVLPLPSKPPARKHPEKLISRNSSAGHRLGRTREPGKRELATISGTSKVLSDSCKAERDKENSGLKHVGQPQKRETSRFSLQSKSQVGSKPPGKNSKQAVGNSTLSKNHRAAAAKLKSRAPLGGPQSQGHSNSVVPTSPPRGRPSVVSRPGVRGQNPRLIKQPVAIPQAVGPPGPRGSLARREAPRIPEPKSRHRASEQGSGGHGRGTLGAKQPAREAGQEPKTPGTRDRRKLLEEWLASKGKCYKRPPMTFPVKRQPPPKEKEALDRSFWDCMEEEMEQQKVAQQIASTLAECMKLADEGVPSEELLAMLSRIPEAEKFARFWACKAKLLARQGSFDAAGLYHAAACAGAVPLQELRDALVDTLKHSSQAWATPAELRLPGKDQAQSNGQGPACQPLSAIKLQVASLPRAKEQSDRTGLKLLTPVRRSLRIERASAHYPQMLRDHNPVVSCLDEIVDAEDSCRFIFRKNEALPETVEMEGFLPRTSAPTSAAPPLRRPLFC